MTDLLRELQRQHAAVLGTAVEQWLVERDRDALAAVRRDRIQPSAEHVAARQLGQTGVDAAALGRFERDARGFLLDDDALAQLAADFQRIAGDALAACKRKYQLAFQDARV